MRRMVTVDGEGRRDDKQEDRVQPHYTQPCLQRVSRSISSLQGKPWTVSESFVAIYRLDLAQDLQLCTIYHSS